MLALNIPDLPVILNSWKVTPELPRGTNIGQSHSGTFLTAHLKEYPPALCAALAQGTVRAMQSMVLDEEVKANEAFLRQCRQMVCREFGHHIGPDHVK